MNGEKITPVEIKSGKTMSTSYFENIKYWQHLADLPEDQGYVVSWRGAVHANQGRSIDQLAAIGAHPGLVKFFGMLLQSEWGVDIIVGIGARQQIPSKPLFER